MPSLWGSVKLLFLTVTYLLTTAIGLGHNISNCPKLEDTQRRQMALHRADRGGGGY